jgi:hypothetical protein
VLSTLHSVTCSTLLLRCFQSLGMQRCEANHTVFYGSWSSSPHSSVPPLSTGDFLFVIIPIHVDNSLIICNSLPLYSWIIAKLQRSLEIIDMGPASLYLGICITHDHTRRKLWQPIIYLCPFWECVHIKPFALYIHPLWLPAAARYNPIIRPL